jgi:hypothetical protein
MAAGVATADGVAAQRAVCVSGFLCCDWRMWDLGYRTGVYGWFRDKVGIRMNHKCYDIALLALGVDLWDRGEVILPLGVDINDSMSDV